MARAARRPPRPALTALAAALAVAAVACSSGGRPDVAGRIFVDDSGAHPLVLDFLDDHRVELFDGCHWSVGATYDLEGGTLHLANPVFMTLNACFDGDIEQGGDDFRTAVGSDPTLELRGRELRLTAGTATLVLTEAPNPAPYCCR